MPLLKPICGQFLSQLSPPVIVRQQPGQNLIHLLNSVLQLWKAVFVIPCRNINGRQIMEKILSFFRTAQIRNQKAEFLLVQFIFDMCCLAITAHISNCSCCTDNDIRYAALAAAIILTMIACKTFNQKT